MLGNLQIKTDILIHNIGSIILIMLVRLICNFKAKLSNIYMNIIVAIIKIIFLFDFLVGRYLVKVIILSSYDFI